MGGSEHKGFFKKCHVPPVSRLSLNFALNNRLAGHGDGSSAGWWEHSPKHPPSFTSRSAVEQQTSYGRSVVAVPRSGTPSDAFGTPPTGPYRPHLSHSQRFLIF